MPNTLIIAELEKEDIKPSTLTRTEKTKLIDFIAEEDYIRDKNGNLVKKSKKDQTNNAIQTGEQPESDVGSLLDSADLSVLDGEAVDSQGNPINNTGSQVTTTTGDQGTTTTGGAGNTVPDQSSSTSTTTNTEPAKQDAKNKSTDSPDGAPETVTSTPSEAVDASKNIPDPGEAKVTTTTKSPDGKLQRFKGPAGRVGKNGQYEMVEYVITFIDKFHVLADGITKTTDGGGKGFKPSDRKFDFQGHPPLRTNSIENYNIVYGEDKFDTEQLYDIYWQKLSTKRWSEIIGAKGYKSFINLALFEALKAEDGRAQPTGPFIFNNQNYGSNKNNDFGTMVTEYKDGTCDILSGPGAIWDQTTNKVTSAKPILFSTRAMNSLSLLKDNVPNYGSEGWVFGGGVDKNGKPIDIKIKDGSGIKALTEKDILTGHRGKSDAGLLHPASYAFIGKCKYQGKDQFYVGCALGGTYGTAIAYCLSKWFKENNGVAKNLALGDGGGSCVFVHNGTTIRPATRPVPVIVYW